MTVISILQTASRDAWPALLASIEQQFGHDGSVEIACASLEAEQADFHWDSRMMERYLGAYESLDDDEVGLDRVAIAGVLRGMWFVATCIVDGDGAVHFMHNLRLMKSARDAETAFQNAR